MSKRSPWASLVRGLPGVLGALAFSLAMGAVWMVVALYLTGARYWFAILAGLLLGYGIRAWFVPWRPAAMVLAAAGTALAGLYMQSLFVGLQLAAVMGLGRFTALYRAGVDMLVALAWSTADAAIMLATLLGMLAALWMAGRKRRPAISAVTHHPDP